MVHTSIFLTQVWRGNLDAKLLLYQSDPSNPDPEDVIICSDYLVGYQMKGAQTIAIERNNMKDLVMRMEDKNGDITGFFMQLGIFWIGLLLSVLYQNRRRCAWLDSYHWFYVVRL
jgi:hypothetical protein